MSYQIALEKAWNEISKLTEDKRFSVRFLADEYDADLDAKRVFSISCNIPAKEHIAVIILHYLIQKLNLKILPAPTGNWISFQQLDGGDGYYPTFKQRTIDVVLRKYGQNPEGLLEATERFDAMRLPIGDVAVSIEPFENVPILITMWKGGEEFAPTANIVFDESTCKIFCTEDIVVLTEIIVHAL